MKSPGPSKKKKWFLRPNHRSWQRLSLVGLTGKAALPTHLGGSPWGELSQDLGPPGQPLSLTSLHSSWGALIPPRSLYLRPWADLFRHPIQEEEGNPVLFHSEPFPIPLPSPPQGPAGPSVLGSLNSIVLTQTYADPPDTSAPAGGRVKGGESVLSPVWASVYTITGSNERLDPFTFDKMLSWLLQNVAALLSLP